MILETRPELIKLYNLYFLDLTKVEKIKRLRKWILFCRIDHDYLQIFKPRSSRLGMLANELIFARDYLRRLENRERY